MNTIMDLCADFSWQGPETLTFAGETVDALALDRRSLSHWIYNRCHAKASGADAGARIDDDLLARLRRATPYDTVPDPGWVRLRDAPDGCVVVKNGIELLAPDDVVTRNSQGSVTLSLPAWRPHLSPGFFVLVGPLPLEAPNLARIYFSGSRHIGPEVVRQVTRWPLSNQRPWSLKVLATKGSTRRTDAVVLYVARDDLSTFLDVLRSSPLLGQVGGDVSSFACPVAAGIAWAHDAGTKVSFGEWISGLIADAVIEGRDRGSITAAAIEVFEKAGVRMDEPWLCSTRLEG